MAIAAAASLTAQDKSYTAPRTPWGHPDLQGVALRLLGGVVHADNDHGNGQGNACRDLPSTPWSSMPALPRSSGRPTTR